MWGPAHSFEPRKGLDHCSDGLVACVIWQHVMFQRSRCSSAAGRRQGACWCWVYRKQLDVCLCQCHCNCFRVEAQTMTRQCFLDACTSSLLRKTMFAHAFTVCIWLSMLSSMIIEKLPLTTWPASVRGAFACAGLLEDDSILRRMLYILVCILSREQNTPIAQPLSRHKHLAHL